MPGMNGEDFLFGLEAYDHLKSIPVIIYTGSLPISNISPGWPGVKNVIRKTGSFHELVASLKIVLKGHPAA
jgi:hypothetical protein